MKIGDTRAINSVGGQHAIAARIEKFWHLRGYPHARVAAVECTVFLPADTRGKFDKPPATVTSWEIRSNLVNGLPPR